MKKMVIVRILNDDFGGIEGLVEKIDFCPPSRFGSMQDAIVSLRLSWNQGKTSCGPFRIQVGNLADGANEFELVIREDVPVPIPIMVSRIFPDMVGLRWLTSQEGKTCWGNANDQPCTITGAGTPYKSVTQKLRQHESDASR